MNQNYKKDNIINKKSKNSMEEKNDVKNWLSSQYVDEQLNYHELKHVVVQFNLNFEIY